MSMSSPKLPLRTLQSGLKIGRALEALVSHNANNVSSSQICSFFPSSQRPLTQFSPRLIISLQSFWIDIDQVKVFNFFWLGFFLS